MLSNNISRVFFKIFFKKPSHFPILGSESLQQKRKNDIMRLQSKKNAQFFITKESNYI